MDLRDWSLIMGRIAMIGQLGLSLIMPLMLCLFGCYLLNTRVGLGVWIYIPGFIFGLGGSFMTAYNLYQSILRREEKKRKKRNESERSFNTHF